MLKNSLYLLVFTVAISAVFVTCKKENTTTPSTPTGGGGGGGGGGTAANFAGTYTVTDGCCSGGAFQITITATSATAVSIGNFRKGSSSSGWNLTGTASGTTLTIPAQNVVSSGQGGPYKFSGTGTLSGNSLSVPYVMADASGNFPQNCTASCTK